MWRVVLVTMAIPAPLDPRVRPPPHLVARSKRRLEEERGTRARGLPSRFTRHLAVFFVLAVLGATLPGLPVAGPAPGSRAHPNGGWDVYIHAHPDDWQLFESPDIYYDYMSGDRILIVYTNAGDAGNRPGWWQAREEGAKASARWLVGGGPESAGFAPICYPSPDPSQNTTCHPIWSWRASRVLSLFMRFPDGAPSGRGFRSTGNVSLARLRDREVRGVRSIDGSTTYQDWTDFLLTLRAMVVAYTPFDASTTINAPDFDRGRQTSELLHWPDHADHLATADAVRAIAIGMGAPWGRRFFIDTPICHGDPRYPANLDQTNASIKESLFQAYRLAIRVATGSNYSTPERWRACFWRDYSRVA